MAMFYLIASEKCELARTFLLIVLATRCAVSAAWQFCDGCPSDSLTKKSALCQPEFLYLQERVMTPKLFDDGTIVSLEHDVLFHCCTFSWVSVGVKFFSGKFGRIGGAEECFPVCVCQP